MEGLDELHWFTILCKHVLLISYTRTFGDELTMVLPIIDKTYPRTKVFPLRLGTCIAVGNHDGE